MDPNKEKSNDSGPPIDGGGGKKRIKKKNNQNSEQQKSDNSSQQEQKFDNNSNQPQNTGKSDQQQKADKGDQQQKTNKGDQQQKAGKGDQQQKAGKGDQQQKAGKGDQQQKAGKGDQQQKAGKGDQQQKADKGNQQQKADKGDQQQKKGGQGNSDGSQKNIKQQQSSKQKPTNQKIPAKDSENSQKESKIETMPSTDKPVKTQSEQQIEQQIQILKSNLNIPKRRNQKSAGTSGRSTELEVNHLPLNLDKLFKKTVYHINILFEPELPKRLLRTALEEFNSRHYPGINFAFDGRKNMYSTKQIKGITDTVSILNDENGRMIDFIIVTSIVNTITMNKIEEYLKKGSSNNPPGEALQALDVVLKNRPFSLRFTNVGRSFFPVPRITPIDLGEGMELWKGFFQSPVMGWKPFLNIDVAHKGFPKYQPLLSYIENELRCNPNVELDSWNHKTLLAYVKGLKVDFMIPKQPNTKRTYKVVGLLDNARNFTFEMNNNKMSVEKYFQTSKNYVIKYPKLPCLHVGNVNKKTAVPIELCTVQKGQTRMKKLTEVQTANMVKAAARPPAERRQAIENSIRDITYNQDPVLREFGIDVTEKFACIPARVLDQPSLAYAQNKETKPKLGIWRPEKFTKAIKLTKWIIINMDQRTNIQNLKNFEKCLIESGKNLNVVVSPMDPVFNYFIQRNTHLTRIKDDVTNFFNKQKNIVELVVVIIPDYPPGIYATVKQASELQVGVLTQCIKAKTIYKMNPTTSNNILLKINSKLNGINHTLAVRSSPRSMDGAIIIGADVTHPSPDQKEIPSVAAVAASHDLNGSQYNMEWRLQDPRMEIIQDLENIIHIQLLKFKEKTNTIPKKIFYFRDGVSEGMFLQLLEHELVSIRRACLRLNINYKPPITFLVVQKRHHTRMFPKHNIDMDGKYGNVGSGTVIDTQITHPTEIDFYLCSHASIQGTSRPTKYHLIWDDNNFTEDELEQLTFYLCFMFVRCTRSVSYPAPTYYAHLAAFRARTYIENKTININKLNEEQKNMVKNGFNGFTVNTPMFFV